MRACSRAADGRHDGLPRRRRPRARRAHRNDWRRFLDLTEELGGATDAANLLETWALPDGEAAQLADRATARAAYEALRHGRGGWAAPPVVPARAGRLAVRRRQGPDPGGDRRRPPARRDLVAGDGCGSERARGARDRLRVRGHRLRACRRVGAGRQHAGLALGGHRGRRRGRSPARLGDGPRAERQGPRRRPRRRTLRVGSRQPHRGQRPCSARRGHAEHRGRGGPRPRDRHRRWGDAGHASPAGAPDRGDRRAGAADRDGRPWRPSL